MYPIVYSVPRPSACMSNIVYSMEGIHNLNSSEGTLGKEDVLGHGKLIEESFALLYWRSHLLLTNFLYKNTVCLL